jgi:energy-coupling factor transport system ATP-binding protein
LPVWQSTVRSARRTAERSPAAAWQQVEVRYPFSQQSAVGPVDLAIRSGERVLLLGASGSGKSTLLLTLTGLIPRSIPATVSGRISIFGADNRTRPAWGWATEVAHYFQDADQTLCGMRVEDEIAFPLENRAVPPPCIATAVSGAMRRLGLPEAWRRRSTSTLSGGERQLVALAATLAQDAPLFVTDEPTAHLAPAASQRLQELLTARHPDRGALIVDHRLDGLIEWIDRVVVLSREGRIAATGHPRFLFRDARDLLASLGVWRPAASLLDAALTGTGAAPPSAPLTMAEALAHLQPGKAPAEAIRTARPAVEAFLDSCNMPARASAASGRVVAWLAKADCAPFRGPVVLRGVDVEIRAGEILGVLGANGAGKSTLGACLSGHLTLRGGARHGPMGGIAFQRSENQFTASSVGTEIGSALSKEIAAAARNRRIGESLDAWGLAGLEGRHPLELSQGEQRRLALATLTTSDRWPLLVLDEPMAGLDARGASVLIEEIAALASQGRAIALITHDMDLALRLCARSIILGEGRVLATGATGALLGDAALLERAGLAEPSSAEASRWLRRAASC